MTWLSVASAILSNIFLFALIFGLSATVDCRSMRQQLKNKRALATGVGMQFVVMPMLGYLAVALFPDRLPEPMGIALLVVTASPGGSYSNWWCSTFNADLALSVAMTTVSSLLSIALLPMNLFLYTFLAYGIKGESSVLQALDFETIFITLGIVLSAILLGLLAGYCQDTPRFHKNANHIGSICGLLLVVFSIALSSGLSGAETKLWNQDWPFYFAVLLPCMVGLTLANLVSRSFQLSNPETVAISIECCYQNTGIATSVAITMFSNPEERAQAVAVPLLYGIVEAVLIGFYCIYSWKMGWTKAPARENLCVVLAKTYEVTEHNLEQEDPLDIEEVNPVLIPQSSARKGLWTRLFGRRDAEPAMEPIASHKGTSLRKRIVSDFTAETSMSDMVISQMDGMDSNNNNPRTSETILEGPNETSDHLLDETNGNEDRPLSNDD